jgi:hypothetical protein
VVIGPGEAVDFVIDRAGRVGFRPERPHVEEVIEAQLAYFEAIGAIAPVVEPDLDLVGDGIEGEAGLGEVPVAPPAAEDERDPRREVGRDDADRGRSPQQ